MAETNDAASIKLIAQNIQNLLSEIKENFAKTVSEQTNLGDATKKFDQIFNQLPGKLDKAGVTLERIFGKGAVQNLTKVQAGESFMAQASKLAARGALTESKLAGLSTALRGGAALGGAAGSAATGGLLAVALGIRFALEQGFKMLGENLAPSTLIKNFSSALQSEFTFGNFRSNDRRQLGLYEYSRYRNQMRQMGIRDEKVIADELRKAVEQGIAGGAGRADAISATISRSAILKTLGIDVGGAMGALYRSTQNNRLMFQNGAGNFDLQRFAQNFGYLAKASENVNGVQVSIKDWYSIFDQLKDRFRGTTNDFGVFQRGLARFGEALTKNEATISDVGSIYKAASNGIRDSSLFKMFALSGVSGGDLFSERLKFIRRGLSSNVGMNVQELAKWILHYGDITGGNDEGKRDTFMRQELQSLGMGQISSSVANLDKFFSSIVAGNSETIKKYEELTKDSSAYLREQSAKLDVIAEPVKHIRDLMFGFVSETKLIRWIYGSAQDIMKSGQKYLAGGKETKDNKNDTNLQDSVRQVSYAINQLNNDANKHAATEIDLQQKLITSVSNITPVGEVQ